MREDDSLQQLKDKFIVYGYSLSSVAHQSNKWLTKNHDAYVVRFTSTLLAYIAYKAWQHYDLVHATDKDLLQEVLYSTLTKMRSVVSTMDILKTQEEHTLENGHDKVFSSQNNYHRMGCIMTVLLVCIQLACKFHLTADLSSCDEFTYEVLVHMSASVVDLPESLSVYLDKTSLLKMQENIATTVGLHVPFGFPLMPSNTTPFTEF